MTLTRLGTIEGDITCSAEEVAADDDVQANPFQCVRPSEDKTRQKVVGLELVAGYDGRSRFKPYVGVGLDYMDLTAELFYSWLSIVRPPSTTSANEGILNGRVFVSYCFR